MVCSTGSDRSFGPRVNPDCRSFDFTIAFEDVFFACLPAGLFILLSCMHAARLLRNPILYHLNTTLLRSKLVRIPPHLWLFIAQLVFLAFRVRSLAVKTEASIAADVLSALATLAAVVLSFVSHQRSQRPSTILNLFLSVSILLNAARTRTLWLLPRNVGNSRAATAMSIVLSLFLVSLALESVETKAKILKAGSPEQHSGIWPRTCFTWLASTFRTGYAQVLTLDDLPPLDTKLESQAMCERLIEAWKRYNHQEPHSLLRACFRANLASFLSPIIPRLCVIAFSFTQPFLINTTLQVMDGSQPSTDVSRGLIGAWALVYLGIANFRFVTRVRGALITTIYHHTLQTRVADSGDITAVSLMGTDVERIVNGLELFHETWGALAEIAVACWLLGRQLSVACIAPLILVLLFVAGSSKLSASMNTAQRRWIEKVQERLCVTSAMLSDMKAVKMLGLSGVLLPVIQGFRSREIETSRSYRKLLVAMLLLSLTPINLAPVVTFGIYTIIAVFWKSQTLLLAQAFTSLSLISLLTTPVIVLIQTMPMVFQCVGNFDRIQEYCNYSSQTRNVPHSGDGSRTPCSTSEEETTLESVPLGTLSKRESHSHSLFHADLRLDGHGFAWNRSSADPALHDLQIAIKRGSITAIIGPVGSGKSSFLHALLGELVDIPSELGLSRRDKVDPRAREAMAYCAQHPWLENHTIRENIRGSSPWDLKWYRCVLSACALETDLAQLEKGDFTLVGNNGVKLSGGQKQRIALARAVYSKRNTLLLDDVFSGIDMHTAQSVSRRLLGRDTGLLRNDNTTVVLTTHNPRIMMLADRIIVLREGRVVESGSPSSLAQKDEGYVKELGLCVTSPWDKESIDRDNALTAKEVSPTAGLTSASSREGDMHSALIVDPTSSPPTDLRRKNGDLSIYRYYLTSSGYVAVGLYALFMVLWIFFTEFSVIWVSWWSEANETHPNQKVAMYMGVYAMMGVLGTFAACLAAWVAFVSIVSNSATSIHFDLLAATLKAPFRFFASTDNGELLNRFSEDMELIDMDLPSTALNYTSTAISCLAQVIILAIFSRSLAIAVPIVFALLYVLQRFYLQTSRQMRLLMIEAKAPLYNHFTNTESTYRSGSTTIRAFGWTHDYQCRAARLADHSQRPAYLQSCIQHWLTFALNVLMAALVVILVGTVVTWHRQLDIRVGGVGVALIILTGLGETLTRLIRTWTRLESSIGAVTRVRRFVTETEAEDAEPAGRTTAPWPRPGAVEFQGVVAGFRAPGSSSLPAADAALKAITLSVQPGEHLAICGRSGSGKTSLLLALLRMVEVLEGQILVEGWVAVAAGAFAAQEADEFRRRLNVVPQDPFLLKGASVRFNLDLYSEAQSEEELVGALHRVGLWELVHAQGGLDTVVDTLPLSAGQQQLFCFARAIVRRRNCGILVLDEATSSLDSETAALVQSIIDSEFRECTVLAVMHMLTHIGAYDRVAVLDGGALVEVGPPAELLAGETRLAGLYSMHLG
ncbi:ABC transporter [Aspergillus pseudonomiae]|nr:ABC transporter [Aspergillus pseudonomiae]